MMAVCRHKVMSIFITFSLVCLWSYIEGIIFISFQYNTLFLWHHKHLVEYRLEYGYDCIHHKSILFPESVNECMYTNSVLWRIFILHSGLIFAFPLKSKEEQTECNNNSWKSGNYMRSNIGKKPWTNLQNRY